MKIQKQFWILIIALLLGLTWGVSSLYYSEYFLEFSPKEDQNYDTSGTSLPSDYVPKGEYSTTGKILAFPAYVAVKQSGYDRLVYEGIWQDNNNFSNLSVAAIIGMVIFFIPAYVIVKLKYKKK